MNHSSTSSDSGSLATGQQSARTWLAALLLQRHEIWLPRFESQWKRLKRLGRGQRRRLRRKAGVTLTAAALLLAMTLGPLAQPQQLHAATITVDETTCTLVDALRSANNDAAYGGCVSGAPGPDLIELTTDVTLDAVYEDFYGRTGLPVVRSEITLNGNGHSIQGAAGTLDLRLLGVAASGDLTVNNVTLSGGYLGYTGENHAGAGIHNQGRLTLVNSTIRDNVSDTLTGAGGIFNDGVTAYLTVQGSTLTDNSTGVVGRGGAIHNDGGEVIISGSSLSHNQADYGGGIYSRGGSVAVDDSDFTSNNGAVKGGAVHHDAGGTLTITNTTLDDNISERGGALYNQDSVATLSASTVSGNWATWHGGAIFNGENSQLTVENTMVEANEARPFSVGSGRLGGGIYNRGDFTATNSKIANNSAAYGAGIANIYGGTVTLTDTTLRGNTAQGKGGGVWNAWSSVVTINSSTIHGNAAGAGGGLYNSGLDGASQMTINNSTVSGNTATSGDPGTLDFYGGGILNYANGNLTINNSTVTGNLAQRGGGVYNAIATLTLNRSIVSGNTASDAGHEIVNTEGTTNVSAANVFGHAGLSNTDAFRDFTPGATDFNATGDGTPTALTDILDTALAYNGGPTRTHALVTGSPAVDRAPSATCAAAPINGLDQRGQPRSLDGDSTLTADECDAGAFEFDPDYEVADIVVAPGEVAIVDNGLCSIVEAIHNANHEGLPYDDCEPGSTGADTIILPAASTFTLLDAYGPEYHYADSGLPPINSSITIEGNGATVVRDANAPALNLLVVTNSGDLTVNLLGIEDTFPLGVPADYGQGVFIEHGKATVSGSHVTGQWGTGIYNNYGTLYLSQSVVSNNAGIAVVNWGGQSTVTDSVLSRSREGLNSDAGGNVMIARSTISDNIGTFGGVLGLGNDMQIIDSTISNNTAEVFGGGILKIGGNLLVVNSTISGNQTLEDPNDTGNGAGIYAYSDAEVELVNVTVTGNTAAGSGGGIRIDGGSLTLSRSIIAGNSATGDGDEISVIGTVVADDHNLFSDDDKTAVEAFHNFTPGASDIDASSDSATPAALAAILNPALANNGGPTLTHALVPGSPALDLAPDADCLPAPVNGLDQRGQPRNLDGDGSPTAAECDSGAFELDAVEQDADGVDDTTEENAPNNGDGNNDGVPDSQQGNVTSLPNSEDGGYVTVEAPADSALENVAAVGNPSPDDTPPEAEFPIGFLDFEVNHIDPGGTATVTLFLSGSQTVNSYWKYGPTPDNPTNHWYEFTYDGQTGAEILADRIILHLKDGARGDHDLLANGTIVDPGAPAFVDDTAAAVFVSAERNGTTADGLAFSRGDVLLWDGSHWSLFFDGRAHGLQLRRKLYNINAVHVPDAADPSGMVVSFDQDGLALPGIPGKVRAQDLVQFNGVDYDVFFDGSDVGLKGGSEKIDGVAVLDGALSPVGESCSNYLLLSTKGAGWVRNPGEGRLRFRGEDVLGFCATSLGEDTTGIWHLVFDGSQYARRANWLHSLSAAPDGRTLFFTTKRATTFPGGVSGSHSEVYAFDTLSEQFSGPLFSAPQSGLPQKVDALTVHGMLP